MPERPLGALVRTDLANARREPLLLALLLMTPLLVVLLRFGFPAAAALAWTHLGVDLEPYRAFALGALLVLDLPINAGALLALVVLDERDERTLSAVGVTPLGFRGYVRYRLVSAAVLATVLPAASLPLAGLVPLSDLLRAAPALLPAVFVAPLAGCVVLLLASNKVEGLAAMKGAGLVWALPLALWFLDGPWSAVLLLVPTGPPLHALWSGLAGEPAWPAALAGTAWSALLLRLLWPAVHDRLRA
jgi:fluoroquinolone transport system permease protein